jgi:hypothetical protein
MDRPVRDEQCPQGLAPRIPSILNHLSEDFGQLADRPLPYELCPFG